MSAQQINTTHAHTAGGWASFEQSTTCTNGTAGGHSTGYYIPHKPPRCFDSTHNPIRTRFELLPSSNTLKQLDPGKSLSSSTRSPAFSFVDGTTAQLIPSPNDQVPGPGKYSPFEHQNKKGKNETVGITFPRTKKKTGDRWESTTGDMPGPGAYGIPEILSERTHTTKFSSSSTGGARPEFEDVPGPGSYRVHPKAFSMTTVKYSSCGAFASAPRFTSRAGRMRLQAAAKRPSSSSSSNMPLKNWESANKEEVVSLTSTFRKETFKQNGKKLNKKIQRVLKKKLKIVIAEEKRCSEILARPDALKKRRWIKTMMCHLLRGARMQTWMCHLLQARINKEKENNRVARAYWFQRFFKYWRKVQFNERKVRHAGVLFCSIKLLQMLHRIRYRTRQANILYRHLLSQISAGQSLLKIREYASYARTIQRIFRRRMMREACHVLILRQQLVREWLVDSSSRQVEMEGEGGGGGGGGGGKKKSKKKNKKKSAQNKKEDGVVEPTVDELEKVMMGVARSQLKKWRDSERKQKLEGRATSTRWGLFSQEELQLLMFEAKELWKYQS